MFSFSILIDSNCTLTCNAIALNNIAKWRREVELASNDIAKTSHYFIILNLDGRIPMGNKIFFRS